MKAIEQSAVIAWAQHGEAPSEGARAARTARSQCRMVAMWTALLVAALLIVGRAEAGTEDFQKGTNALSAGKYVVAAKAFASSAAEQPATGTLQNLGLAEWQRGRRGHAVLAWEQALWVDPYNEAAGESLLYARKVAQLEGPELAWHEAASMWLPVNAWAVLAGVSLWFAIGMLLLPRILHWQRAAWHQATAAAGFAVFLLCLPSLAGVHTRTQIGFVLEKETPLRLTPTQDAQTVSVLVAGQPARWEKARGKYLLIRTSYGTGWIEREQFGRVCPE